MAELDYETELAVGRLLGLFGGTGIRKRKTEFLRRAKTELDTSIGKAGRLLDMAIERGLVVAENGTNPNPWGRKPVYLSRTSVPFAPPPPPAENASDVFDGHLSEPVLERRKGADGRIVAEVWISVPDTLGRFEVSNFGHLRQMGSRTNSIDRFKMRFRCTPRPLVSEFDTGRLGWCVRYDNESCFFDRGELMKLFEGIEVVLDPREDDSARSKRDLLMAYAQMAKESAGEAPAACG